MTRVSVETAYEEYIENPDAVVWYDDSQVEGIQLSDTGVMALLSLADGSDVEVFIAETVEVVFASAFDGSEDQEQ